MLEPSLSHLLCLNPAACKPSPNFISLKVPAVEPRLGFPEQKKHAVSKDLLNTGTVKCSDVSRESKPAPRGAVILLRHRRERCKHRSVFRLLLLKSAGARCLQRPGRDAAASWGFFHPSLCQLQVKGENQVEEVRVLAAWPLLADVQLPSAANSPILLKITITAPLKRTLKHLHV